MDDQKQNTINFDEWNKALFDIEKPPLNSYPTAFFAEKWNLAVENAYKRLRALEKAKKVKSHRIHLFGGSLKTLVYWEIL